MICYDTSFILFIHSMIKIIYKKYRPLKILEIDHSRFLLDAYKLHVKSLHQIL